MIKRFIKYSVYLLLIIIISLLYLTYFGVETKKFNQLIKDEIIKDNTDLDLEIKKVKLVLKPKTLSVGLETKDSNIKWRFR